MIAVALLFCLAATAFAAQTYPGTATRPILSSSEASYLNVPDFLQGWTPETITTTTADYTVGSGYATIQAAVNAAINAGGTTRKHIRVPAGTYAEVVYIPNTNVPITIYGDGNTKTIVSLSLSATLTGAQYTAKVGKLFASGDPAYSYYSQCAERSAIGTACSSVFWIRANGVQITDMEIENSSALKDTDQAVALQTDADQIQLNNLRLLSHQDTLCSGSYGTALQRSYITNTFIAGDVDFVFGGGATVFTGCTFYVRADRRSDNAIIFAPDTHPDQKYGYLVTKSMITGDSAWSTSQAVNLARSWDMGLSSASQYVAGTSPNGAVVIRECSISGIVNNAAPYASATSGRTYNGNTATTRNFNDNNYNRFWEYANTGSGA